MKTSENAPYARLGGMKKPFSNRRKGQPRNPTLFSCSGIFSVDGWI